MRLAASIVNDTKATNLLADRDDEQMMPGLGFADVVEEFALLGLGTGKGNSGDICAYDVAERSEYRLERRLADGLKRGQVAGLEDADRRAAMQRRSTLDHSATA